MAFANINSACISIYDIAATENLTEAFYEICGRKRSPGIDGLSTFQLARDYDPRQFRAPLLDGTYRPLGRLVTPIPKSDGELRFILISSAIDAVIERAVTQQLNRILDHLFHFSSFGGRPNLSAEDAIRDWVREVERGNTWVTSLDIKNFFDEIDRVHLLRSIRPHFAEKDGYELLKKLLNAPSITRHGKKIYRQRGIGQGPCFSPFLGNLYLSPLDRFLTDSSVHFIRYIDDIIVATSSEKEAHHAKNLIASYLQLELGLKLNAKSKTSHFWDARFLGFSLSRNGSPMVSEKAIAKLRLKLVAVREFATVDRLMAMDDLRCLLRGWINYYRIAENAPTVLIALLQENLDPDTYTEIVATDPMVAFSRKIPGGPCHVDGIENVHLSLNRRTFGPGESAGGISDPHRDSDRSVLPCAHKVR